MAKSVQQELRELRERVRQLEGRSNDEVVDELVGRLRKRQQSNGSMPPPIKPNHHISTARV
jgi:hypothetical protein